jgi:hypothetical protein
MLAVDTNQMRCAFCFNGTSLCQIAYKKDVTLESGRCLTFDSDPQQQVIVGRAQLTKMMYCPQI